MKIKLSRMFSDAVSWYVDSISYISLSPDNSCMWYTGPNFHRRLIYYRESNIIYNDYYRQRMITINKLYESKV